MHDPEAEATVDQSGGLRFVHPAERIAHVLKVFLVDGEGRVRNIYSTGFLDLRLLLADLETVLGSS